MPAVALAAIVALDAAALTPAASAAGRVGHLHGPHRRRARHRARRRLGPRRRRAPARRFAVLRASDRRRRGRALRSSRRSGRFALAARGAGRRRIRRDAQRGSTIEMQLARSIAPQLRPDVGARGPRAKDRADRPRAADRDRSRAKRAVLEAYVNRIPMGGNVYGVEAAARTYFGEPAGDLDLAQASLLAAIPNDPARLQPGRRLARAARSAALRALAHGRAGKYLAARRPIARTRDAAPRAPRDRHRRRGARALLPLRRGPAGRTRSYDARRGAAAVRRSADANK